MIVLVVGVRGVLVFVLDRVVAATVPLHDGKEKNDLIGPWQTSQQLASLFSDSMMPRVELYLPLHSSAMVRSCGAGYARARSNKSMGERDRDSQTE